MLVLRDYQEVGAHWLEHNNIGNGRFGGLLADDVGLGKTPQALAALHTPALIVTPNHLTYQWFDAACEQLPNAVISMPEGTRAQRQRELDLGADVTIVSYEMLRTYNLRAPHTFVLEEAHRARHASTDQSKAAKIIADQSAMVYLLTASPYYKSVADIWNLLRILDARNVGGYWDFLRRWFAVNWGHPYTPKIYGIKPKLRDEWHAYMSQYMLMRTYADVGRELPPLIEKYVSVALPTTIRPAYDDIKKRWKLGNQPIESAAQCMVLLRQLTMNHAKVAAVLAILDSIPREPALIYVWYRESAQAISSKLKAPHVVLTGAVPASERAQLLRQATAKRMHIIATVSALSEGANLQHLRHVVYSEESYVPEEHRQTLSRVRRDREALGVANTAPVIAYYVRTKRTIDEIIPRARNRAAGGISEVVKGLLAE